MGVGKTTVCQKLKRLLQNSVFLDGDWCWDMDPFVVTEETKAMERKIKIKMIIHLLEYIEDLDGLLKVVQQYAAGGLNAR